MSNILKGLQQINEGTVEKTKTGLKHSSTNDYPDYPSNKGREFQQDPDRLDKSVTGKLDKAFDVKWEPKGPRGEISGDPTGVDEGEEMGTFAALKDWRVWDVRVFNNFYRGKYADYGPRLYSVVASSPEEARQVVIDNPDYVLQDLLSRKLQSGKKVLPRSSALPVEEKRVGKAEPGSITTMGFKKMLTPDGVQSFKFAGGKIVDGAHMAGGEEVQEASFDYTMKDLGNDYAGFPSNHSLKHKFLAKIKPEKQQLYKDKMNNMHEFDQLFQLFTVAKQRGDIIEQGSDLSQPTKSMGLNASLEQHADDKMKELGPKFKGVAEGLPKQPKDEFKRQALLVKDRKTGKLYDPNVEFDKKMNSPEVKAQMKRMAQKEGVAEESNAPVKYRATVEYGPTAADAHFVTVTATSTEEAEAKVQKWCEKKGVRNPMITINGADKPVDVAEEKQRLDPKCWSGYKKQGTKMKGDTRVNNCVPVEEGLEHSKRQQLIRFLAKKLDWEVSYLELASDANLISWYKKVQAGKNPMGNKELDEANPHNFDSDVDYYAAQNAPAKARSHAKQSPGVNPDDEDYFREIFRKKRLAAQKAEREQDHDRLASGTNESVSDIFKGICESKKMSAAEKLQRAFQQEQEKSQREREVGQKYMNSFAPKKDEKKQETSESFGNNYPQTYEEENDPFKSKGKQRPTDLTT